MILIMVEHLGGADVRLFFLDGTVIERSLSGVKNAKKARVIDEGLGLDPGDGKGEISASTLYRRRGGRRYSFAA